jgi:23S rRNA (adenine2503-C2)-methyltransferase
VAVARVSAQVIVAEEVSASNRRFVRKLADGALIESVLYRGDTLCLSTQVGCAVRCPFCASGANGLGRSLTLEEMIAQVQGHTLRGVTLSGIGEPLHNPACVELLEWARARGLRVTLTTSGGPIARLREWLVRPHHGLTLSVHAGTEEVRARAVPHAPSLDQLFATLHEIVPQLTNARRKKTALAYLAIADLNDHDAEVDAFIARARPLGLFVHLYDHNPVPTSAHRGVGRERYLQIHARMQAAGLVVRRSSHARLESNGGCGTLVALRAKKTGKMAGEEGCHHSEKVGSISPER